MLFRSNPLMKAQYGVDSMPETGENVAEQYKISRADQDAFAARSQKKAATAQENGRLAAENTTANLVRSCGQLVADISAFMTLFPGDILLVGEPANAPLAVQGIKRTINMFAERGMSEAMRFEAMSAAVEFVSDDMTVGYAAKAKKESAEFEGK